VKIKQKILELDVGQYIDTEYEELAQQLDEHPKGELKNIYSNPVEWIEEWKYNGQRIAVVGYREGTGIMVKEVLDQ